MIDRYTRPEMRELWSEQSKFQSWLDVEQALLNARCACGLISKETCLLIARNAAFSVERINELDEGPNGFRHDLLAFVETVKECLRNSGLPEATVDQFHKSATSYDIEDPAFVLLLGKSANLILAELDKLIKTMRLRLADYLETPMMGVTHGQSAEPITLAVKLLNYVDDLERDGERIEGAQITLNVGKFSGAVGMYGDLTPEIEHAACEELELEPARIATQIIHRDRHAAYMSALSILGSNLGHIAHNLWLMCQSTRGEAREPFRATQRGSSRMPHKKNPILDENLKGGAIMMRAYLSAIMETITTSDERDISQSLVERIVWPDATTLVHFMLYRLTNLISGIEFFPEVMLVNIARTKGQHASGYVKDLLIEKGLDNLHYRGERASVYDWVQKCAFEAWPDKHLKSVMIGAGVLNHVSEEELDQCFDSHHHIRFAHAIYERFGIKETALSNEAEI